MNNVELVDFLNEWCSKCEIHDYCERIGCVETDKIIGIFEKLERTETNENKSIKN